MSSTEIYDKKFLK